MQNLFTNIVAALTITLGIFVASASQAGISVVYIAEPSANNTTPTVSYPLSILGQSGKYSGPLVDGLPQGSGEFSFDSGWHYNGEFVDGLYDGIGVLTSPDGYHYEGDFKGGLLHGHGIFIYPNGDQYTGGWKESQMHGEGVLIESDGTRFEGRWRNGMFSGESVRVNTDGSVTKIRWSSGYKFTEENRLNGALNGIQKIWYRLRDAQGPISSETYYSNGLKVSSTSWHKNGELSAQVDYEGKWGEWFVGGSISGEGFYKMGELHGEQVYYYQNGSVERTESFRNGEFVTATEWYLDGQKRQEWLSNGSEKAWYPNGQIGRHSLGANMASTEWYPNGQLYKDHLFMDGKLAKSTTWAENGQKVLEQNYVLGVRYGMEIKWWPNGQKRSEVNYVDGKRDGKWIRWTKDGKRLETLYKAGVKVDL